MIFLYIDVIFNQHSSMIFQYKFRRILSAPTSQKYEILFFVHMVTKNHYVLYNIFSNLFFLRTIFMSDIFQK